jgi:hypothetical protein
MTLPVACPPKARSLVCYFQRKIESLFAEAMLLIQMHRPEMTVEGADIMRHLMDYLPRACVSSFEYSLRFVIQSVGKKLFMEQIQSGDEEIRFICVGDIFVLQWKCIPEEMADKGE